MCFMLKVILSSGFIFFRRFGINLLNWVDFFCFWIINGFFCKIRDEIFKENMFNWLYFFNVKNMIYVVYFSNIYKGIVVYMYF